jgi:hypothetical protein
VRWSPSFGGILGAVITASLCLTSCHEATPLRLSVQSPASTVDCVRVADRVFFEAAFERVSNVSGPDLFYSPRVAVGPQLAPRVQPELGWGIGVWLKGKDRATHAGRCAFELESLQAGPMCWLQCPYSSQRGEQYDQTLKDFARRLSVASR